LRGLAGTRTVSLGNSRRSAMSDRDKPVNPFGRSERTIIRPNPGGRLPQAPAPYPSSSEQQPSVPGARGPFSPSPLPDSPGSPYPPPAQYQPVPPPVASVAAPPSSFAPAPTSHTAEEWISSQNQQAPQQPPAAAGL